VIAHRITHSTTDNTLKNNQSVKRWQDVFNRRSP